MDKALEEPNFADVYADLCKEFHLRTTKKSWSFLSVLSDENDVRSSKRATISCYPGSANPFIVYEYAVILLDSDRQGNVPFVCWPF